MSLVDDIRRFLGFWMVRPMIPLNRVVVLRLVDSICRMVDYFSSIITPYHLSFPLRSDKVRESSSIYKILDEIATPRVFNR